MARHCQCPRAALLLNQPEPRGHIAGLAFPWNRCSNETSYESGRRSVQMDNRILDPYEKVFPMLL